MRLKCLVKCQKLSKQEEKDAQEKPSELCAHCGGPDSRPRGRRGLAIYPLAARHRRDRRRGGYLENRISRGSVQGGEPARTEDRRGATWRHVDIEYEPSTLRRSKNRVPFGHRRREARPDGSGQRKRCQAGSTAQAYDLGRRVRSWLRMNAGGAPNTCKSNGTPLRGEASGERLSNT